MGLALVTGAAGGIGVELCRGLLARGHTVLATCRDPGARLSALGVEILAGIDLTDDASHARILSALAGRRCDVLIHNAGLLAGGTLDESAAEMLAQFAINAVAPVRLTRALRESLGPGSKVVVITSRMGSIADNGSGGYYGYRMSKAAVNAAAVSLAHDLKPEGVAVLLLHPGFVRTPMTGGRGHLDPSESAALLLARIDELNLAGSGRFLHADGSPLPW